MVPKEYTEHYSLMLYYDSSYTLTLVRRSKDSCSRKFDRIKNCPDCIFFGEDLPIAMTFGKQLKYELAKCNISMINNVIECNNKEDKDTIITQIEYILEYLNNTEVESDNIEKELEEKYKDEIDNLKVFHDTNLLYKCFTTMKTKMEKINVI
jgi:hypothetical protein